MEETFNIWEVGKYILELIVSHECHNSQSYMTLQIIVQKTEFEMPISK